MCSALLKKSPSCSRPARSCRRAFPASLRTRTRPPRRSVTSPASLSVFKWKDSRDCAASSTSCSSHTQRSPCDNRRTISRRVSSESAWNCRAARLRSGTVVVGMMRIVSSFVDVSMGARRPQLQVDRQAGHRAAGVRGFEARRDEVDRPAGAQTHRQPRNGPNHTPVAERQRADVVFLGRGRRRDHELLGALAYILGTTKDGVRPVEVESGLEHNAVRRLPGADQVIRPPDERARPLPASTERLRGERRRTVARSEEHTSELQSLAYLVCRLLLEKKKM